MSAAIFLVLGVAMVAAWRGHRTGGLALFAVAMLLALGWFDHHATDALKLDF